MDGTPAWADRPFSEALSPDGRWLLFSSDGQSTQSLKVVDTTTGKVTQTIPYTTTGNTEKSPLAEESAAMNFDSADAPNNRILNEAIWHSVKGARSPMPEPQNATVPRDTDG